MSDNSRGIRVGGEWRGRTDLIAIMAAHIRRQGKPDDEAARIAATLADAILDQEPR